MKLQLNKALVFLDIEATGLDVTNDRIVEISVIRLETDGSRSSLTRRVNPGVPIPPETTAIHGISDEDVKDLENFRVIGTEVRNFIGNADLAGFNSSKYDIPLLVQEFSRHQIEFDMGKRKLIDVQNIFHKMERRNLEAAYKFYCQKELRNAHSADADVGATLEILEAQLDMYEELEPSADFLHTFSAMNRNVDLAGRIIRDDKDVEVFNFGKYKGRSVRDVFKQDPSYYSWIQQADFTEDTKKRFTEIKLSEFKS